MRFVSAFAALFLACTSALANDGYSEIGVGGLVLSKTNDISMDKEELFVSADKIRVDYVFTNTSDKDIEADVMFPLPDIKVAEYFESAGGLPNLKKNLKFKTVVNGKPFPIEVVEKAFAGGKDITADIEKLGLPVSGDMENYDDFIRKLKPDDRKKLFAIGALPIFRDDNNVEVPFVEDMSYPPEWTVKSYVARKQVFKAKQSITVSHSYVPQTGATVPGNVDYTEEYIAQLDAEGLDLLKKDRAKHCIDDDFVKAYRTRVKKEGGNKGGTTWVSYILSSGSTWKGPIKDFRLVVDKGNKYALVSFCGDGVKKISPTQFEMRKKNFEPSNDLNVLIMNW